MKTLLNLIWLILSGLWMALGYVLAGLVCCVLIITIPWGLACFRIAAYALWPFGRTVVQRPDAGAASGAGNVVWLVFAGIWLTLGHITMGVALCATLIGIPFGLAHFKMIPVSLMPLGREIVPTNTPAAYPGYRW
ncbi:YccF domain-containing protein [Streptomyces sp. CA-250714]|uniref:YccF domain-containing protein n=1 Tax=Streptomyces sp. CA-250714 TaxID=3240060 RepID=UPI003D9219CF